MTEEDNKLNRRTVLGFGVAGAASFTALGMTINNAINKAEKRNRRFLDAVDEPVEEIIRELDSQDFEYFDTDAEDLTVDQWDNRQMINIGVDIALYEDDLDEVRDTLADEPGYVREGAELFGIIAENLYDIDDLEKIQVEYRSGVLEDSSSVTLTYDDLPEQDFEDFYRKTVKDKV